MEKHKTLIKARTMFGAMYNPIKRFFDMYVNDDKIPSTYLNCIFIMQYREYIQWEIVHLTIDLEVACRYLKLYTKIVSHIRDLIPHVESPVNTNVYWRSIVSEMASGNRK